MKALSPEQAKQIFDTIEAVERTARHPLAIKAAIRDALLFRLLFYYALRTIEASRIATADYTIARGIKTGGWIIIEGAKGGNTQKYNISVDLRYYFERWLAVRPESRWLFPSYNTKNHIGRQMIHQRMQIYCAPTDIPPELWHPHAFRHACGQTLTDKGSTPLEVRDYLRQKSIDAALIYANCSEEHVRKVQNKLPIL